ncbi:hypothetical protein G8759_31430 [Spirosoma aureum]|uniref:Uncharacterized protein n=1 Tax=Spirosoma aureum TaxID=2692134 RepID=A0A6G9AWW4_9BACT|nr:hypothetical protein [Spirosoma aureum]QIP16836.1 hypothetical protein G8759_31430 [Spirosoma aureum]
MSNTPPGIPEHLFIQNPLSGRLINVLPLFDFLTNTFAGSQEAVSHLQLVHDFLSTCAVKGMDDSDINVEYLASMNYTLIMFRQVFEKMQEVKA